MEADGQKGPRNDKAKGFPSKQEKHMAQKGTPKTTQAS